MAFVLDASITACWAFDDEDHPDAGLAFDRMRAEEAAVPSLWWFEVRNILILIVNERRRRVAFSRRKRGPPAGPRSPESGTASFLPNLSPAIPLRCRLSGIGSAGGLAAGNPERRPPKGSGRRRGGTVSNGDAEHPRSMRQ